MFNSLAGQSSSYLASHAKDLVHWRLWGKEAFAEAKAKDKPLFIHIGYSSSHWCQVMTRESFCNEEVAAILNERYIPVLADRDLEPGVEDVYMRVSTLITGSAGWPLNVAATPGGEAFYTGTYISRVSSGNRPGLLSLLCVLADKWDKNRSELLRAASEITAAVRKNSTVSVSADMELVNRAVSQLSDSFDGEYGGFGKGAKFPGPQNLLLLIRHAALTGDKHSREIAEKTLQQMYRGGIYDHFGGGFCRNTVDREWLKPNFEKLLSDNAFLAYTYTESWHEGKFGLYRTVAESTLDYCLRELKADNGGFFCAQDSDTDGMEGTYYLFTPAEIRRALGEDDGRHFCECYDITEEGNIKGRNIPNLLLNNRWGLVPEGYDNFREKLRLFRDERCSLGRDNKIVAASNGMMLMALSKAAAVFDDARYLSEALDLAAFISESLMNEDGSMARCVCCGRKVGTGTLEDYVFTALGMLELYSACYDASLIEAADMLCEKALGLFKASDGGFYDTVDDALLPVRARNVYDSDYPSGNSAMAVLLMKLSLITGRQSYVTEYAKLLEFLASGSAGYPAGCAFALTSVLEKHSGAKALLCVNKEDRVPDILSVVTGRYAPDMAILLKTPSGADALSICAPWTTFCEYASAPVFYVCTDGKTPAKLG